MSAPLPAVLGPGAPSGRDLFGESLPAEPFASLEIELRRGFDAVFLVGTSAMFPYIVRPVQLARAGGGTTIEINPSRTDLTDIVDFRVRATARDTLLGRCGDAMTSTEPASAFDHSSARSSPTARWFRMKSA